MTVQTLGGAAQDRRLAGRWFVPLIPIAIAVFCLSALAYYRIWQDGATPASGLPQQIVVALYEGIGFVPAFMFFLLVLAWSSIWFLTGELDRPGGRLGRLVGLMVALAILVNLRPELDVAAPHGGELGSYLAMRLQSVFGYTISTLLVAPLALCALLLATDFFFYRYFEGMGRPAPKGRGARRQLVTEAGVESVVTDHFKGLAGTATVPEGRKTVSWEDLPEIDLEGALPDEPYEKPASPVGVQVDHGTGAEPEAQEAEQEEEAEVESPEATETASEPDEEPEDTGVVRSRRAERLARELGETGTETGAEASADPAVPEARTLEDLGLEVDEPEALVESSADEPEEEEDEEEEVGDEEVEDEVDDEDLDEDRLAFADEADEEEEQGEEEELDDNDTGEAEIEDGAEAEVLSYEGELDDFEAEEAEEDEADEEDEPEADVERAEAGPDRADEEADEDAEEEAEEMAEAEGEYEDELLEEQEERAALPDEPVVPIPRPSPAGARQGRLFSQGLDPGIVDEARELVRSSGRASASHLQRRLRIEFEQAMELLSILAGEGLIEMEEGATSGRVVD